MNNESLLEESEIKDGSEYIKSRYSIDKDKSNKLKNIEFYFN